MTLYYYFVTVKHDNGKTRFKTVAQDEPTAKEKVCQFEGCPPCAIVKCKKGLKL